MLLRGTDTPTSHPLDLTFFERVQGVPLPQMATSLVEAARTHAQRPPTWVPALEVPTGALMALREVTSCRVLAHPAGAVMDDVLAVRDYVLGLSLRAYVLPVDSASPRVRHLYHVLRHRGDRYLWSGLVDVARSGAVDALGEHSWEVFYTLVLDGLPPSVAAAAARMLTSS